MRRFAPEARLRRRLQLLSCRIARHPYGNAGTGGPVAARAELRRQARIEEPQEGRTA
ncbi:hypothetical protein [Streptomyces sp. NPDC057910]|uniref:hypothetical protein n=1 Tax=Streptomyces sp. NPDC057910 TaxID=3346278 RepID=UPI0036E8BEBA